MLASSGPYTRRNRSSLCAAKLDDGEVVDANGYISERGWDYMKAEFKDLDPKVMHNIASHFTKYIPHINS